MADITMNVKISFVTKTTADWATVTTTIPEGCPCAEITTDGSVKFKIGDGSKTYADLNYIGGADLTKKDILDILGYTPIDEAKLGVASGVATLDATGKIPEAQLPSYVDDTVEGYLKADDELFYEDSAYTTKLTSEKGKIYVDLSTNKCYRWSGTAYVEVAKSTIVVASTTNGSINVNGTDIAVYDYTKDTALKTVLDGKISSDDTLVLHCTL